MLFLFGTMIGSYLNVVGTRYTEEDNYSLSNKGRSHCPYCNRTLRWLELIPLLSFALQIGKCRTCKKRLSLQYPLVEIITGLVFVLVPETLGITVPGLIWLAAFSVFIVISIIDFRLKLIPDELNILIALLGLTLIGYYFFTDTFGLHGGQVNGSFLGSYAVTFWFAKGNIFINYLAGFAIGMCSLGLVYLLTMGKGMGFGDVKLSAALGILMGWPDILVAIILAFFTGAATGLLLIFLGQKKLKGAIPFGPFIVLGVTLVFLFGYDILNGYFSLFNVFDL